MSLKTFKNKNIDSDNILLRLLAEKIEEAGSKKELTSISECWGKIIKENS